MPLTTITQQLERLKESVKQEKNRFFESLIIDDVHYGLIEVVESSIERTDFFIIGYRSEGNKVKFRTAHQIFPIDNRSSDREEPFIDPSVVLKEASFSEWQDLVLIS